MKKMLLLVFVAFFIAMNYGCGTSFESTALPDAGWGYVVNDGSIIAVRMYFDSSYCTVQRGQKYLALGIIDDRPTYSDEEIMSLSVGEEFTFDRDISFTIEKIERDDNWNTTNIEADKDRPDGKITLNNTYCFVHPEFVRDEYGIPTNLDVIDNWVLAKEEYLLSGTILDACNNVYWFKVNNDCIINYYDFRVRDWIRIDFDKLPEVMDEAYTSRKGFTSTSVQLNDNELEEICFYLNGLN